MSSLISNTACPPPANYGGSATTYHRTTDTIDRYALPSLPPANAIPAVAGGNVGDLASVRYTNGNIVFRKTATGFSRETEMFEFQLQEVNRDDGTPWNTLGTLRIARNADGSAVGLTVVPSVGEPTAL